MKEIDIEKADISSNSESDSFTQINKSNDINNSILTSNISDLGARTENQQITSPRNSISNLSERSEEDILQNIGPSITITNSSLTENIEQNEIGDKSLYNFSDIMIHSKPVSLWGSAKSDKTKGKLFSTTPRFGTKNLSQYESKDQHQLAAIKQNESFIKILTDEECQSPEVQSEKSYSPPDFLRIPLEDQGENQNIGFKTKRSTSLCNLVNKTLEKLKKPPRLSKQLSKFHEKYKYYSESKGNIYIYIYICMYIYMRI